jgi:Ca-activated chloride channel family protein
MLTLAHPWLFLLLPLPWLVRKVLPAFRESRASVRVPFMQRLTSISGQKSAKGSAISRRSKSQWFFLLLAWIGLVMACTRPQWLEDPIVNELPMRDLLLALDLSGSMETREFTYSEVIVSDRFTAAQQVLDEFLTRRDGDRIGLILFGNAAFVQVPFTDDLEVVRELLNETRPRMLGPRTMLGDAMGLAISLFEKSEVNERVLITLTDGNDTGSLVPPDRAAEIARDKQITIHTVAMGDPEAVGESPLDEATLRAVADITGGSYFRASDRQELDSIYLRLDQLNPRQVETQSYRPKTDLFYWPLSLALLSSLMFFGFSELRNRLQRPSSAETASARA